MTRFDEQFDTGQPADGLEDELRRMLARREADITEPAGLRPGTDAPVPVIPRLASRASDVPGGLPGTLLAAAVVTLLVLGSVLGARSLSRHHSPAATQPTPSGSAISSPAPSPSATAKSTSCPLPASWAAALSGGRIAVDQPQNYPVSAGPDGTFLMLQTATGQVGGETDFTHQELAIFDRNGHGTTVWQAADPVLDNIDISPDSATSANWVVFGLRGPQSLAAHAVAAWNRSTGHLTTVRLRTSAEQAEDLVIDFDPIVVGDTAHWIEQKYGDDAHQTLVSQPLPDGQRSTQPVSHVSRLIAVGSGVALLHAQSGTDTQTLASGPGLELPANVLAAGTGTWFGSAGANLGWLDSRNPSVVLRSWSAGDGLTTATVITSPGVTWVWPFLSFPDGGAVYDTRNFSTVRLPAGLTFALATGNDLITVTGTTKFGPTTVHRVPLSALPPTHC
ncbi:MAG TPA: hypothetical protein VJ851_16980 [Jatrophihabitans sp.]|nr:hypothetical protein [Jatrophihabitans sp.]